MSVFKIFLSARLARGQSSVSHATKNFQNLNVNVFSTKVTIDRRTLFLRFLLETEALLYEVMIIRAMRRSMAFALQRKNR